MNTLWVAGPVRHCYQLISGRMVRKCDGKKTYMEALVAASVPSPPDDKVAARHSGYCPRCLGK